MQFRRLGKTYRLASQSLDARPECEMFALNALRLPLRDRMLVRRENPLIRAPAVRIIVADVKRLQQGVEFFKDGIGTVADDIGQHGVGGTIHRMPEPALVALVLHKTPLLIQLARTENLDLTPLDTGLNRRQHGLVHLKKIAHDAVDGVQNRLGTDLQRPPNIADATPIHRVFENLIFHARFARIVPVLRLKRLAAPLTPLALCSHSTKSAFID